MSVKVDAEVRQLKWGSAYVNVLRNLEGGIALWGHAYERPTYLVVAGNHWMIVTYDSEEWRDESLEKIAQTWAASKVLELPTLEEVIP